MNDALIEVKHLTFKRGERVIYRDLNLRVPRGKITAIMGPSGIGKTGLQCAGDLWGSGDHRCNRRSVYCNTCFSVQRITIKMDYQPATSTVLSKSGISFF